MFNKRIQERSYAKASTPEDLPWHRDGPHRFLEEAIGQRDKRASALDLGCGSGVMSVYMAKQGLDVTAIDLNSRALAMSKTLAARQGVNVTWVLGDLLSWKTPDRFDIILDSACLHSLIGRGGPQVYRAKLLSWIRPSGDYILVHFGKRHPFDWRPIGPARRSRTELRQLFFPELTELDYESNVIKAPLAIGPTVQDQAFWFRCT